MRFANVRAGTWYIQKGTRVRISLWGSLMFGRVPGTRPNTSESHSEISTRVPVHGMVRDFDDFADSNAHGCHAMRTGGKGKTLQHAHGRHAMRTAAKRLPSLPRRDALAGVGGLSRAEPRLCRPGRKGEPCRHGVLSRSLAAHLAHLRTRVVPLRPRRPSSW